MRRTGHSRCSPHLTALSDRIQITLDAKLGAQSLPCFETIDSSADFVVVLVTNTLFPVLVPILRAWLPSTVFSQAREFLAHTRVGIMVEAWKCSKEVRPRHVGW